MDTSKTYIKMCGKAEEIQTLKVQNDLCGGNFYADNRTFCWWTYVEEGFSITPNFVIWLPRQDQLQEMVIEHWGESDVKNKVIVCLDEFQDWVLNKCDGLDWSHKVDNLSMEQLWLAFVMKEKYNKVWDGKEWK